MRVDLYVDPVCPYSWLASRWLAVVERHRDVELRYHPMSLYFLNEQRHTPVDYWENIARTRGPSRVVTAAATQHGEEVLPELYTRFGEQIFDRWRYPEPEELDAAMLSALTSVGLPTELAAAAHSTHYDDALRRSHEAAVGPVGPNVGTPIVYFDGAGFFGPVLNSMPTEEHALDLFDGTTLLARIPDFYELKRDRVRAPDL